MNKHPNDNPKHKVELNSKTIKDASPEIPMESLDSPLFEESRDKVKASQFVSSDNLAQPPGNSPNQKGSTSSQQNKSKSGQNARKTTFHQSKNPIQRIKDQMKKEFKLLKADKMNLFIAILLPPLTITLFAIMLQSSAVPPPVQAAIISYDSNTYIQSNSMIQTSFANYTLPFLEAGNQSEQLDVVYFFNATEDYDAIETAQTLLRNKQIQVIIVLPADFSELLYMGMPGVIDSIPDTQDVTQITRILNSVQDTVNIFAQNQNFTQQFQINGELEYSYPPGYDKTYNYYITMVLGFVIFAVSCVLTILVVVQEQPIPRLLLTPVSKGEILLSKYITYVIILLLQIILIYLAAKQNGLYIRGKFIDLFLGLFVLGYVGISLGMFISTVSKTKMEANQLFFAFFIIIFLFSGMFIPINSMPSYLQIFANAMPLAHGSPMIQSIVAKGKTVFGPDFRYLIIQGLVLTGLSFINILRKDYEV